jgi:hypothetical protein
MDKARSGEVIRKSVSGWILTNIRRLSLSVVLVESVKATVLAQGYERQISRKRHEKMLSAFEEAARRRIVIGTGERLTFVIVWGEVPPVWNWPPRRWRSEEGHGAGFSELVPRWSRHFARGRRFSFSTGLPRAIGESGGG